MLTFLKKFKIPLCVFIITLRVNNLKCYRVFENIIYLKTDYAIDILQEIFHVIHKNKSCYEKLYLIFRIGSQ